MKRFLGILLVIIFFVACGKREPKGIFPQQKMTDILFDLHLADGYISSFPIDSLKKEKVNYYLSVYQKYDTDSAEVKQNLDYYAAHPQDLEDVYAAVSKRLQGEEESFRNKDVSKHRAFFVQDSIIKQRTTDSLHLLQRDSAMHFIGTRDLFTKKDSVSADSVKNATMQSMLNQQRRWEKTFYYFSPSNFLPLQPETPSKETPGQSKSLLKKEDEAPAGTTKERIPN